MIGDDNIDCAVLHRSQERLPVALFSQGRIKFGERPVVAYIKLVQCEMVDGNLGGDVNIAFLTAPDALDRFRARNKIQQKTPAGQFSQSHIAFGHNPFRNGRR